jgi:hypothetical protein
VVETQKPYYTLGTMDWADKSFVDYSALVLPMSSDGEHVDIIIASMQYL